MQRRQGDGGILEVVVFVCSSLKIVLLEINWEESEGADMETIFPSQPPSVLPFPVEGLLDLSHSSSVHSLHTSFPLSRYS